MPAIVLQEWAPQWRQDEEAGWSLEEGVVLALVDRNYLLLPTAAVTELGGAGGSADQPADQPAGGGAADGGGVAAAADADADADAMVAAGAAAKAAGNAAPGGSWSGRRSRKAPSAAMKPCCGTPLDLY